MTEKPTVLIVDDAAVNIEILAEILDDLCDACFALDGERAIAIAREQSPRLILLDVVMPGIDGFETCRRLRADPATAGTPILLITADIAAVSDAIRSELDISGVLSKPIQPAEVRAKVAAGLGQTGL